VTIANIVIVVIAGIAAEAKPPEEKLTVYIHPSTVVPVAVQVKAQATASSIFRGVGVHLDWRNGKLPGTYVSRPIAIELQARPPAQGPPGEIGYALTSDGVHIQVFYDEVKGAVASNTVPNLLAYVLVHEITHLLEGVGRHSETGIMKPHWTYRDIQQMVNQSLSFASEDVILIHQGIASRAASRRN
jgi:hypothetical protein